MARRTLDFSGWTTGRTATGDGMSSSTVHRVAFILIKPSQRGTQRSRHTAGTAQQCGNPGAQSSGERPANHSKMRLFTWFGGTAALCAAGEVFLSGNPDQPHVICWSDSKPLYFSEDNRRRMG